MIQVRDLTKRYGALLAVDGLSFTVEDGDILGFLGPNGAGKSTTMRILTCYTPPSSGEATVAGLDIRRYSTEVRRLVGYLPESNPLYPDMSVRGYVEFMARLKGVERRARKERVAAALDETGLSDVASRLIRNLSKGYRQRVGLAQALVGDPRVLILDEPTVGLDPGQIREIRSLIRAMRGRRTVLLSTHILPEVSMTCNKVVIINEGRIEASGTPENLVSQWGEAMESRVAFEGDREAVERALRSVDGVRDVRIEEAPFEGRTEARIALDRGHDDPRPAVARAVIEAGGQLYEFRTQGMTLEDIYLRVVSKERTAAAETAKEEAGNAA